MSTAQVAQIERMYCRKKSRNIYLALEELDFTWDEREIATFERLWKTGISLWDIAKKFERDPDEVLILAMDRGRKGRIRKRVGGVFGETKDSVHCTGESRSSRSNDTEEQMGQLSSEAVFSI